VLPSVPIPSNVTLQLGEALDWSCYGPEASEDPEILQACYDEITGIVQKTLDGLASERPYPILSRLNELRPSKMVGRWIERFSS
jgi:hypothetical protein